MSPLKLPLCGALSCALAIAARPSSAQTLAYLPLPPLETVVVTGERDTRAAAITATKTDTPPMETPLSVQVVTQETLQDQAVVSIDQALKDVSGVSVGAGGGANNGQPSSSLTLRGFHTDTHFRNGVRLDSFASDSGTQSIQLANVDSVAVLKGPAAILYGAVEPGGIVNIVTKQPEATASYSIEQQIGAYAFYRTTLDATGPLTDDGKLLYRLDASYENSGSWVDFIYNRTFFIAPTLAYEPDRSNRFTLEYEYKDLNQGQIFGFEPLRNGALLNTSVATNYGEPSPDRERTQLVTLAWRRTFNEAWSLKAQTLYNWAKTDSAGIFPFSVDTGAPTPSGVAVGRFINQIHNHDYTVSANLDIVGHFATGPVQHTLLIGGDYVRFDFWGGILQAGQLDSNISEIDAFNPVHPGTPFSGALTPLIASTQVNNTAGGYVQDQLTLPFDLHLLAGARYQFLAEDNALSFAGAPLAPSPHLVGTAVTPRVGVLWQPAEWVSLYGNYATNFGPSNGAIQPDGRVAPPTSAHQWEIGAKTIWFDQRLDATIAYYDLTKTNIPTPDPLNTDFELVIGKARSTGVEIDVEGKITPAWDLIANFAQTDARVVESSPIDNSPPGTPLGEVPKILARLWTTYEFQSGAAQGLKVGGGATYNGAAPYLFAGGNPPLIPAYQTFDLMAAYSFKVAAQQLTAQLNATNILDRRYFTDIQAPGFAPAPPFSAETALYGAPRMVVASLKVGF